MTKPMLNITRSCSLKLDFQVYLTNDVLESCVQVTQAVYEQLGIHPADRLDMMINDMISHLKQSPNDKPFSVYRYPSDGDEFASIRADLVIKPFFDDEERPSLLVDFAQPMEMF